MIEALIGLLGVGVGFILTVGYDAYKKRSKRQEMNVAIKGELRTNLNIIPHKRLVLQNALERLEHSQALPIMSVRFVTTAYTTHLPLAYPTLTELQSNSLHIIYQHIRIIDDCMESFLDRLLADMDRTHVANPLVIHAGQLRDLISAIDRLQDLLQKHLAGNPVDVLYLGHQAQTANQLDH